MNPPGERLFGYAASDPEGKNLDFLIAERFRTVHEEHVSGFLAPPQPGQWGTNPLDICGALRETGVSGGHRAERGQFGRATNCSRLGAGRYCASCELSGSDYGVLPVRDYRPCLTVRHNLACSKRL